MHAVYACAMGHAGLGRKCANTDRRSADSTHAVCLRQHGVGVQQRAVLAGVSVRCLTED